MGKHPEQDRNGRSWDLSYSKRGAEVLGTCRSGGYVLAIYVKGRADNSQSTVCFFIPRIVLGDAAGLFGGCYRDCIEG